MTIEGKRDLPASAERVFYALTNPEILCKCIPGCERLVPLGDNNFEAVLAAGVGPLKGRFSGRVRLEDTVAPSHYRIQFEGKGGPGFVKGSADFNLTGSENQTSLHFVANVNVGGPLAGIAQRMLHATAQMLASRFFNLLEKNGLNVAA